MPTDDRSRDWAAIAFDGLPAPSALLRLGDGAIALVHANPAFDTLVGGDPSDWLDDDRMRSTIRASLHLDESVDAPLGPERRHFRARARLVDTSTSDVVPGALIVLELRTVSAGEANEHELRSTIGRLQDLVDNSIALMYIKDVEGRYLIVNDFFARRFGVDPAEIVGKTDHDLFPDSSADVYSSNDDLVLATGASIEVEEPFAQIGGTTDPDDDHRWLSIKFPLLDASGEPYAMGAISTDITDRKRAESAANRAMHEAEHANRSKNEFLSRMSHELRTPLNAIIGFAQLLGERDLEPELREDTAHILEAGHHLLALVNDVLDITWIEAGSPGLAVGPVGAAESIQQALELIRPLAAAADIEIASDLHGAMHRTVLADGKRLKQVFLNVLANAVKFNRARGAILVRCVEREGMLRYLITDTGSGMTEADVERLFQPFVRLEAAADHEGSGLGLALSRGLVEQMGGSLGVEHTAPGEGSTFSIDVLLAAEDDEITALPLDSIHEPFAGRDPASGSQDVATHTILHIEDTPANIRLVERIVEAMGHLDLVTETSGRHGVRLAQHLVPSVILLDLNLADISGVDVVLQLQNDPRTADIPVIVLSADATPARVTQLRSIGVFDYLTKPLDVHDFARTVRRALDPT